MPDLACIAFSSLNITGDIGKKVAAIIMTTITNTKKAVIMQHRVRYLISHLSDSSEKAV
jgi:hypothetical protein